VDIVGGELTFGEIFHALLPFSNNFVTFEMLGSQVKTVLKKTLSTFAELGNSLDMYVECGQSLVTRTRCLELVKDPRHSQSEYSTCNVLVYCQRPNVIKHFRSDW